MTGIPEITDGRPPRIPCALTEVRSEPTLAATRSSARGQLTVPLHQFFDPDLNQRLLAPVAGPPATAAAITVQVRRTVFDYDSLAPDDAEFLRRGAARIRAGVESTMETVCLIGANLYAAKRMLGHGQFVQWVESECGFSPRSAQNYMRASEFAGDKCATVAFLPPAVVYRLAAPTAPPEVVFEVLARAANGERVSHAEVIQMLRSAKERTRLASRETENKRRRAGPPHGEALPTRGDAHSAIAKANARTLMSKFGRGGAVLLLGMQENILETLAVLAQEINASNGPSEGEPFDAGALLVSAHQVKPRAE
jgi:hypothetical protein